MERSWPFTLLAIGSVAFAIWFAGDQVASQMRYENTISAEEKEAEKHNQELVLEQSIKAKEEKLRIDGLKLLRPSVRHACERHFDWTLAQCQSINGRKISIGMNSEQAILAWGKPDHINTTQFGLHWSEQWVYEDNQFLYFEDGVLSSWQQTH